MARYGRAGNHYLEQMQIGLVSKFYLAVIVLYAFFRKLVKSGMFFQLSKEISGEFGDLTKKMVEKLSKRRNDCAVLSARANLGGSPHARAQRAGSGNGKPDGGWACAITSFRLPWRFAFCFENFWNINHNPSEKNESLRAKTCNSKVL